jgi:hypothetical protein
VIPARRALPLSPAPPGASAQLYADRLAKRGYNLILVDRSEPQLKALSGRLKGHGTLSHPDAGRPQQQGGSREGGKVSAGESGHHHARR